MRRPKGIGKKAGARGKIQNTKNTILSEKKRGKKGQSNLALHRGQEKGVFAGRHEASRAAGE